MIFVDEIDSLLSARKSDGEPRVEPADEATEFLVQMDGLGGGRREAALGRRDQLPQDGRRRPKAAREAALHPAPARTPGGRSW